MLPSQVVGKKRPRDSKQKYNGFIVGDFSSKEERKQQLAKEKRAKCLPRLGAKEIVFSL